eukprot:comp22412_c1_seq1/m.33524 comp22412_c1_seq1/g.33524  ORF comp22412_c1_seq1/g.33524 comp22412_c1_seq1/m.33524 type:complete len:604 (-) comp22412_c1_seq1:538-2349(-)
MPQWRVLLRRTAAVSTVGVASAAAWWYYGSESKLGHLGKGAGTSPAPKLPTREDMFKKLEGEEYDVLVLGGGSTGCGVALDAATRGLKVAVVEKIDFGAGTSGASTKLLHGGVRYLEKAVKNLDKSQLHLVMEALHERATMMAQAPHLTKPIGILTPLYSVIDLPQFVIGLKLYDFLSGSRHIGNSYYISPKETAQRFPVIMQEGLKGSVVYYDGQFDDARFNVALALTAAERGVAIVNHTEVVDLNHDSETKRVAGATIRDRITNKEYKVRAKAVVNATGHFADSVRKMDSPDSKPVLIAAAGSHIVLDKKWCAENEGLLIPKTDDGRVVFLLPWLGSTLAGTTDGPCEISDQPKPTPDQIEYIIKHLNKYFNAPVSTKDVKAAWSGIRPLKRSEDSNDTAKVSREHGIYTSNSGLMTIVGGKWTTYRRMAEDVVNTAVKVASLNPTAACGTETVVLIGGREYNRDHDQVLVSKFGLPHDVAFHLNQSYGDQATTVAELSKSHNLTNRLAQNYGMIEGEVIYAVRNEYAATATDYLARRTRLAFLDHDAAREAAGRVIELMGTELKWDAKRRAKEMEDVEKYLDAWSQSKPMGVAAVLNGKH